MKRFACHPSSLCAPILYLKLAARLFTSQPKTRLPASYYSDGQVSAKHGAAIAASQCWASRCVLHVTCGLSSTASLLWCGPQRPGRWWSNSSWNSLRGHIRGIAGHTVEKIWMARFHLPSPTTTVLNIRSQASPLAAQLFSSHKAGHVTPAHVEKGE